MPVSLRRSVKAGPFRFNLSPHGLGVSAGVKGFRVGLAGPRGHYIRMGGGGVYYRKSFNRRPSRAAPAAVPSRRPPTPSDPAAGPQIDLLGTSVVELDDATESEMVADLNNASRPAPLAAVGRALLFLLIVTSPLAWWLQRRDRLRRTVVAMYDFDDESSAAHVFQSVIDAFRGIQGADRAWMSTSAQHLVTTQQRKVHAGAAELVSRAALSRHVKGPKHLRSNIDTPSLEAGKRGVYLLPDQMLIRDGKAFAAFPYHEVEMALGLTTWIESGSVPADSERVGTTWQFANARGGPDRRYKNNRQLPEMQYAQVVLATPNGSQCWCLVSSVPAARAFFEVLQALRAAPAAKPSAASSPTDASHR
jgi:Protein of unknown function (DUF4236)